MLLASVTVERFNSRRGVAHFGHLLLITSKDLAPKALRRMCEPLYRRQGGRAPRPALAYQHHFGGAAADRREERKEHPKLHVARRFKGCRDSWCVSEPVARKGCRRDNLVGGVILSAIVWLRPPVSGGIAMLTVHSLHSRTRARARALRVRSPFDECNVWGYAVLPEVDTS